MLVEVVVEVDVDVVVEVEMTWDVILEEMVAPNIDGVAIAIM